MKISAPLALAAFLAIAAPAGAGPLHEATSDGDAATIARLLEGGASVHAPDAAGNSALHPAAANGDVAKMGAGWVFRCGGRAG